MLVLEARLVKMRCSSIRNRQYVSQPKAERFTCEQAAMAEGMVDANNNPGDAYITAYST